MSGRSLIKPPHLIKLRLSCLIDYGGWNVFTVVLPTLWVKQPAWLAERPLGINSQ
jgi:hypothetical protein